MRQIVLDTETTGLSPKEGHRIIEIGCIELINRRLTDNHLHFYINPEREIEAGAAQVHGITTEFLKDKPLFKDIAQEFIEFVEDAELIIHNAPFDVGFLNHEFKLIKNPQLISDYCAVIDTLVIARKKHPGQQVSLDALCRRYQIDHSNRELHGALLDAQLLAQVYLRMTGGQTAFDFEAATQGYDALSSSSEKRHQKKASYDTPLTVLTPTESEIQDHENFLRTMQKQEGICHWNDFCNHHLTDG